MGHGGMIESAVVKQRGCLDLSTQSQPGWQGGEPAVPPPNERCPTGSRKIFSCRDGT